MGRIFSSLSSKHVDFIDQQKMFFVATAGAEGRINLSPKGLDSFRIIDSNKVIWLNLTGSGNETAAHVFENGRMTVMFCAFEGAPLILRLSGKAACIQNGDALWEDYLKLFDAIPGARQVFELTLDKVQTSCGFGVPLYAFQGERKMLDKWAEDKGEDLKSYWQEKNMLSIDGKPTGIKI
jgi:hypothetical protein